ncbi:capsule assembly Wzi family protein [Pseudoalteromonas aliena]|uniref:capsule assembly Wzi family protein n=1 Tax=Pseudoalteromonas aliena TaxID=247523 RepID=UPI00311F98A6
MKLKLIKPSLLTILMGFTLQVFASPTAYLPVGIDAQLDHQLDTLFALTSGTPMTKPYRLTEVEAALVKLQNKKPALAKVISDKIKPYQVKSGTTRTGLKLRVDSDNAVQLANQRGVSSDEWGQVFFEGILRPNDYSLIQVGLDYRAKQNKLTNYNTFVSVAGDDLQLNVGYKEHWFSPFKQSAQIVSTNARTSPSISLGMVAPAHNWWNFDFELYYSELEHVDKGILYQGELHDGTPQLAGTHISFEPMSGWKIGLNRMMQFGGGPREVGFSDVAKAFFDPAGQDNADLVDGGRDNELGDQFASITSSFNFDWGLPAELYFEYGGEDTKNHSNYQLGNTVSSVGLFMPYLTADLALRYEYTNMHSLWYVNQIYSTYGNTKDGYVIGHFAGDQRTFGDATPSDIHVLEASYNEDTFSLWRAKLTVIDNASNYLNELGQAGDKYERAIELQVSNNRSLQEYNIETTLTYGEDVFGEDYAWLSVALFW